MAPDDSTHDDRPSQGTKMNSPVHRRNLVKTVGAAGLAGVAGCTGGGEGTETPAETETTQPGGGGETETTPSGGGEPIDPTLDRNEFSLPTDAQFNPYNPANFYDRIYGYLGMLKWPGDSSLFPGIATDFSLDVQGGTMTINLRDDYTWHDGEPLTAEDLLTKFRLDLGMGLPMSSYVSGVQKTGDYTVELSLTGKTNQEILKFTLLPQELDTPNHIFGKYRERFSDATTEDAKTKVQSDLQGFKLDDPIGNWIFKLVNRTKQAYNFELHEDHPHADKINYPKHRGKYIPTNQKGWAAFKEDSVDYGGVFTPADVLKQYPDHLEPKGNIRLFGQGVCFDHTHPIWKQRSARRAIAYIIDRKKAANDAHTEFKSAVTQITGMYNKGEMNLYPDQYKKWLPSDLIDSLIDYPTDTDKAASLFKDIGASKQKGTWTDSEGNPIKAPIQIDPCCSDWVKGVQSIVAQLKDFGLKATVVTKSEGFWTGMSNGKFKIGVWPWTGGQPHPYYNFQQEMASSFATDAMKYPAEVSVPPVGKPDGEPQTVNVRDLVNNLETSLSGSDKERRIVRQLAWVVNHDIPMLPIMQSWGGLFYTMDHWKYPRSDLWNYRYLGKYIVQVGGIVAKTK